MSQCLGGRDDWPMSGHSVYKQVMCDPAQWFVFYELLSSTIYHT